MYGPQLVRKVREPGYADVTVLIIESAFRVSPIWRGVGGLMSRVMVGLLAAVATTMPALVPFGHGILILVIILVAGVAAALVAGCAAPDQGIGPEQVVSLDQKKIY